MPARIAGQRSDWRRSWGLIAFGVRRWHSIGVLVPLVFLWLALAISSPNFFTSYNITNLLRQASLVGILALGSTFVLIAGEIDLSIGALQGLCAVVAGTVVVTMDAPWPLAVIAAIGCGLAVGMLNGLISTFIRIPSFITTLAMLGIASGISLVITKGQSIVGFPSSYQTIAQGEVLNIPNTVLLFVGLIAIGHFILNHTRFGIQIYSVGSDEKAAAEVGIRPRTIKTITLAIGGGCAGLGGVLISSRLGAANGNFGEADLLDAIAAVIIGGTAITGGRGTLVGTALGMLMIVTIRNGLVLHGVSPYWDTAAVGAMILVSVVIGRVARGVVGSATP